MIWFSPLLSIGKKVNLWNKVTLKKLRYNSELYSDYANHCYHCSNYVNYTFSVIARQGAFVYMFLSKNH